MSVPSSARTPQESLPPVAASPSKVSRKLPLALKLPLLIFGILASVLAISLGVSYYEIRRTAELSAADRLASLSRVLSSLVEQQTTTRMVLRHRVATDTAVVNAFRAQAAASPAAVLAMSPLVSRADSLSLPELWTPDGRPLGDVRLEPAADMQRFRDDFASLASLSDSGRIGRLFPSGTRAAYWEATPVRQDGRLLGFVAQERHIGTNPRTLQPFRDLIGADIDFYLRNADDDMWVQPLSGALSPAPVSASSFGKGLQHLGNGSRGDGLAATAPVKATPFLITVEEPMRVILARPRATIRILAAIASALAVAGAGIAWLIGRRLSSPLVDLTGAAEAIAHGEYSKRVAASDGDEIGRLGAAFNRMAEQVQVASRASSGAVEQLTKSVGTQQFLAEASRILASSLSDQVLLSELARYCVPTIADYCSIHLVDDDGAIRRVETAHYDPTKQELLRSLVNRYQYRVDGPGELPQVIRSQKPIIVPRLDASSIRGTAPDSETVRLFDQIGPTSFMCVPLVARGRGLGAMSFTMTDSGRAFTAEDTDLATELARRTAVAVDNTLIYRRSLVLRSEAEAASSAKSDFLAKMSHELRTPINAMMGYAELLEMGISGPVSEAQARQLGRIRASGEHLTALVNEILDLAKIEAGRMGVEPMIGVAREVVDSALSLIRPMAAARAVELAANIGGDADVSYLGDPQRVQQILTNLLSNAVRFTPSGGLITTRCGTANRADRGSPASEPGWTFIAVEDTGIGIAAENLERVFHPFVQVDDGYTRAQGGTGLGLTISRGLAEMMDGEITVESTLGKGSCFTLWLPSPNSCTMPP